TIYLGQAVPIESLKSILPQYPEAVFISYFTVAPGKDKIDRYIADFNEQLNCRNRNALWLLGKQWVNLSSIPAFVSTFTAIEDVIKLL
ncbi:MAG: MerR family transcriptional regulator, partial [Sinomicrobium sp.]|nr:MerR family transcriptional regulator [Sinomicrobium sp.]